MVKPPWSVVNTTTEQFYWILRLGILGTPVCVYRVPIWLLFGLPPCILEYFDSVRFINRLILMTWDLLWNPRSIWSSQSMRRRFSLHWSKLGKQNHWERSNDLHFHLQFICAISDQTEFYLRGYSKDHCENPSIKLKYA